MEINDLHSIYLKTAASQVFGDDVIASAILDRLLHHSEIFVINGPSYRIKDKLATTKRLDGDHHYSQEKELER